MKRLQWANLSSRHEAFHIVRAHFKGRNAASAHKQDFPEVFWIEEGFAFHWINGERFHLQRGDLVFIRSTDQHSLSSASDKGFLIVNIAFPQSTLDFLMERYFTGVKRWFWKEDQVPEMLHIDSSRLAWLQAWVGRLDSAERTRLEIEIFLLEMLHEFQELKTAGKRESGPEWFLKAMQNLNNPEILAGGTGALARMAGRTPQHMNACMKRYRGVTATDAINTARMELAKRELRTSTRKILEICFDCGFCNLAHFYRLFKKASGTTPHSYRQRHQLLVK